MKYRLGSLTIEAIDTYVRVSVANVGGPDGVTRVAVTKRELPTSEDVAALVMQLTEANGALPDRAVLQACGRAADDARRNRMEWDCGTAGEE